MDFETIVKSRFAVKKFDGKIIPQEKIDQLFELIRLAPSSFNIQPWVVKVVTDQKVKDQLMAAAHNQSQVGSCSHLLVFCANTDVDGCITLLEQTMIKNGAQADKIKGYIDMMRGFEEGLSAEHKLSWAQRQVYIALAHALLGAKSLGFDSCPMEGFNPEEYSRILVLPSHIVPSVVCPIGYAADSPQTKLRLKDEDVFEWR